jgi:hypothetical protein
LGGDLAAPFQQRRHGALTRPRKFRRKPRRGPAEPRCRGRLNSTIDFHEGAAGGVCGVTRCLVDLEHGSEARFGTSHDAGTFVAGLRPEDRRKSVLEARPVRRLERLRDLFNAEPKGVRQSSCRRRARGRPPTRNAHLRCRRRRRSGVRHWRTAGFRASASVGPKTQPFGDTRAEALDERFGPFDQAQDHLRGIRSLQVDPGRAAATREKSRCWWPPLEHRQTGRAQGAGRQHRDRQGPFPRKSLDRFLRPRRGAP